METFLVRTFSFIFVHFRLKGAYRLANFLYSYRKGRFQKGVWLKKKYLDPKYNLVINLFSKDLIDHKILFTGKYEKDTNWVLENHVHQGQTVLEAGANSGTETLLISRLVGDSGFVHAFEPFEPVTSKLIDNLRLNDISNVEINKMALGESEGTISFFVYPADHPNQGMGSTNAGKMDLQELMVKQTTIDSLFNKGLLKEPDFIKMDVQGSELSILKGGRNCIIKCKPKIFLEAAEGWSNISDIYDYLTALGYTILYITNRMTLEKVDNTSPGKGNWLALPSTTS